MTRPSWAPEGIDLDRPSASRVYDYFVGGMHNFEIDRELAQMIEKFTPNVAETMRANRDLLRRCVRVLTDAGIDQFLDLGSGIPTVGNVHEVAQARNPRPGWFTWISIRWRWRIARPFWTATRSRRSFTPIWHSRIRS